MLSALNWRRLATQTPLTGLVSDVLDTVYNSLLLTTYYDGSSRTPGSGSAWTVSRAQAIGLTEAVYASPPTTTALAQKVILAGRAASGAGTMATPDTSAAGILQASVNKNSGAYSDWTTSTPFTTGQFFGYWRVVACGAVTISKVNVLESEEAIAVFFETNAGAVYGCFLGSFLDPLTTSEQDAESDGRLYGVITSGTTAAIGSGFWTSIGFLSHGTSASTYHSGVFSPGLGTLKVLDTLSSALNPMNTTRLLTTSGAVVACPVLLDDDGGTGRAAGRLREVTMIRDGKLRDVVKSSGVDVVYGVSGSPSVDQDSIGLLA